MTAANCEKITQEALNLRVVRLETQRSVAVGLVLLFAGATAALTPIL